MGGKRATTGAVIDVFAWLCLAAMSCGCVAWVRWARDSLRQK
jgi:hypothetical protein